MGSLVRVCVLATIASCLFLQHFLSQAEARVGAVNLDHLLTSACSYAVDSKKKHCEQVLKSAPKIASATSPYDVAVAALNLGIYEIRKLHRDIIILRNSTDVNPTFKKHLDYCAEELKSSWRQLRFALPIGEDANVNVLYAGDAFEACSRELAENKVLTDLLRRRLERFDAIILPIDSAVKVADEYLSNRPNKKRH